MKDIGAGYQFWAIAGEDEASFNRLWVYGLLKRFIVYWFRIRCGANVRLLQGTGLAIYNH